MKKRIFSIIFVAMLIFGVAIFSACKKNHQHTMQKVDAVAATCTEAGNVEYYLCTKCNNCYADADGNTDVTGETALPAAGHRYLRGFCTVCGEAKPLVPSENCSHATVYWETDKPSTCITAGIQHSVCDDCGIVVQQNVAKELAPHTEKEIPALPATCTQSGLTVGTVCTVCNAVVEEPQYVKPNGHNFQNNVCTACGVHKGSSGLLYELRDTYAELVGVGIAQDEQLAVADFYKGLPVKKIASGAFRNCDFVTKIILPDQVEEVGMNAFDGCPLLQFNQQGNALYLGNDQNPYLVLVRAKGTDVEKCDIHSKTRIICGEAFRDCTALAAVTIPTGVTTVDTCTFQNCTSLVSVSIPASVISMAEDAFIGCTSLTEFSVASANPAYKSVAGNLYSADGSILVQYAVGKQDKTFSVLDGVVQLGRGAFYGCGALTGVTLPQTLQTVCERAFEQCTSLVSISLPQGVVSVEANAFAYCTSLCQVDLPSGINLAKDVFAHCTAVIYCVEAKQPADWQHNWQGDCFVVWDSSKNAVLIDGLRYALAETATVARQPQNLQGDVSLPAQITHNGTTYAVAAIGDYAFADCSGVTSVQLPSTLTTVGEHAFDGCNLQKILLPIGVAEVEAYAFDNCPNLTIYCAAESQPLTWNPRWNYFNCPVVWGSEE